MDVTLPKGTVLQRFGGPTGGFLAPAGTLFLQLALNPSQEVAPYFQYVVADPNALPAGYAIEQSVIAPYYGQAGGGIQYRIVGPGGSQGSVNDLLQSGYLAYQ